MQTLLTIIQVISSLFLIVVVIIQGGNQGGVSAAFGGGNSQGVFGATGATTLLGKLTYFFAAIFMASSVGLSWNHERANRVGLKERLEQQSKEAAPAATTPAPTTPAPVAPTNVTPPAETVPPPPPAPVQ